MGVEPLAVEYTLLHLIDALQSSLKVLTGEGKAQLEQNLHDSNSLPNKKLYDLASQAIDLLNETQQLLEPSPLILADHFLGYANSKCLNAVVDLGVPDLLVAGPKPLTKIAKESSARPDRLRQVMRALVNNGIFSYDKSSDTYSNNRTSELLLSNHWQGWNNWVNLYGNEFYDMARGIPSACAGNATRSPAQINYDTDDSMFKYFSDKGWVPKLHKTLGAGAIAQAPGILADYPWDQIADGEVLDIGGGGGALLASLLRNYPSLKGGIFDMANVIEVANKNFHTSEGEFSDVGDRVTQARLIVGDFLESVPSFDYYTMKWCLHDWDDSKALRVLTNIRKAIKRGHKSRLIILESILADGRSQRLSRYADLNMWIAANGQERTEKEWISLAEQTGWKLNAVYQLRNAWPSAIELLPDYNSAVSKKIAKQLATESDCNNFGAYKNEKAESYPSEMSFLEPWDSSKGQPFFRSACQESYQSMNFTWEDRNVFVTNARPSKDSFKLDVHGFAYLSDSDGAPSSLLEALRSGDKELVSREYYPRVETLVKNHTGASRVIIFDSTTRKRDPNLKKEDNPNGKEQPATTVHCDQGPRGAIRRLRMHLPDSEDADALLAAGTRVQAINVWRPLRGPVVDWPLAQMDYSSLEKQNIYPVDLWRGSWEDRGQTMTFTYNSGQKWYYLDGHQTDEVTLLKIWDSKEDVARCCPHAAFSHPATPVGCDPRESIEVRCLVIY